MTELAQASWRAGAIRSVLIAYGIAAFTFFWSRTPLGSAAGQGAPRLLIWGTAVQGLLMLARWLVKNRIADAATIATALMILELIGDGVTVALFAIGTLGAITHVGESV